MATVDSFAELFFKVCQVTDGDKLSNFSMLLWSLWKRRNTKLWEGKLEDFKQVMARANEVLNSWLFARSSQSVSVRTDPGQLYSWVPLSNGYVKCNIDAAIFRSKQQVGVGACLRGWNWSIQKGFLHLVFFLYGF